MKRKETRKTKESLPLYGVGPIYVFVILLLDAIGIALSRLEIIPNIHPGKSEMLCVILGAVLIVASLGVFIQALIMSKLQEHIKSNHLVVTGIYAYMRNPIYSAFSFASFGVLLIYGNIILFPLLLVDWVFLTELMKNTEEKWLLARYGKEYIDYCRKVNRFFPWFSREKL